MLRKIVALFLIWGFLITGNLTGRVSAQTQNNLPKNNSPVLADQNLSKPVLKEALERKMSKARFDNAEITVDSQKMENGSINLPTKRRKLSSKDKTFLVVFFVGLTVLVVLLAKYGKVPKCADIYCAPGDTCPCDD